MNSAPKLLTDGPTRAQSTIILAHGAGAGMDTDFMDAFAHERANIVPTRHETGKGRPPDREPVLRDRWHRVIESVKSKSLHIRDRAVDEF